MITIEFDQWLQAAQRAELNRALLAAERSSRYAGRPAALGAARGDTPTQAQRGAQAAPQAPHAGESA